MITWSAIEQRAQEIKEEIRVLTAARRTLLTDSGPATYMLIGDDSRVVYVGASGTSAQARIRSHRAAIKFTDALIFPASSAGVAFELEAFLIAKLRPSENRSQPRPDLYGSHHGSEYTHPCAAKGCTRHTRKHRTYCDPCFYGPVDRLRELVA